MNIRLDYIYLYNILFSNHLRVLFGFVWTTSGGAPTCTVVILLAFNFSLISSIEKPTKFLTVLLMFSSSSVLSILGGFGS